MSYGDVFVPTTGTWARRIGVLILIGLAGFLTLGPSPDVITKFVAPAAALMFWRNIQRSLAQGRRRQPTPKPMSKKGYAIAATLMAALLSLPLWILCDKALIAITLVPAIICVWFAVYLWRGV